MADALSRLSLRVTGGDPYSGRELRSCVGARVEASCGHVDVDMMARGDGGNASGPSFYSLSRSAFGAAPPSGQLWWPTREDMIDIALDRILKAKKEGWRGAVFCLPPDQPRKR